MSIWFLLWLFLSLTLLYFFGWTLLIVHRQKQAWSTYAKKMNLRYVSGAFSEAPQMEGVIDDHTFSFFPAQYELGDIRHNRKMTAVEVTLHGDMPFDGFVASGMLVDVAKTAELPHEFKPQSEGWNNDNAVLTNKPGSMQAYLTPERMDIINRWMAMKNVWFILAFRNDTFLLRIDTPNPLDNAKRLNALVKNLIRDAKKLEPDSAELSMLKMAGAQTQAQPILSADSAPTSSNLQLEDEGDNTPPEPPKNENNDQA